MQMADQLVNRDVEQIPIRGITRRLHERDAMPFQTSTPRADLLIFKRSVEIVRKPVSDFAYEPEIIQNGLVQQSQAVSNPDATAVGAKRLIVPKKLSDFLRVIREEGNKNVLKQRVEKGSSDNRKCPIIAFFVLEQSGVFEKGIFQGEMPFQILSCNPELVEIFLIFV